jgi:pimeloyl-ACP methyl ester carboxylesterase
MAQIPIVDASRSVVRGGTVLAPQRDLPTDVWSPTGAGEYPLVVFIHGYDTGPLDYSRFCSTLASSGYVVAAPSFPLEDPSRGFGLDRRDLPDEVADISFVITALEQRPRSDQIDRSQIAVVGHSDGADVALMAGYQVGRLDPRVRAVVADAPDPLSGSIASSTAPLLLIQGTADSVVPYSASQTVFGQVRAPDYFVSLLGADHLPPIAGGTEWTPVLDEDVADFLDATVAGRGSGAAALISELDDPPLTRLLVAHTSSP